MANQLPLSFIYHKLWKYFFWKWFLVNFILPTPFFFINICLKGIRKKHVEIFCWEENEGKLKENNHPSYKIDDTYIRPPQFTENILIHVHLYIHR